MKRLATIIVLSTGLIAGPVAADPQDGNLLNKENVSGAIGATIGGFLGSKVGDGKGRLVTTAAGAVGGFLLGKKVAHNYGGKRSSGYRHRRGYQSRSYRPQIHPMKETLVARTASNVRAGPSTRFSITDRLHRHERVLVVGKVKHRDWYLIRDRGRHGFVYAPLLGRPYRGHGGHAWRNDHDRDNWRDGHGRDGWQHRDRDDWNRGWKR